jgi:hypothetical protein
MVVDFPVMPLKESPHLAWLFLYKLFIPFIHHAVLGFFAVLCL